MYEERIFPETAGEQGTSVMDAQPRQLPHPAPPTTTIRRTANANSFADQMRPSLQNRTSDVGDRSVQTLSTLAGVSLGLPAGPLAMENSTHAAVIAQNHVHREIGGTHDMV